VTHTHRRGAALPAVLGALVLVALLVAAVARDVVRAERATRVVGTSADAPGTGEVALLRAWSGWAAWEGWSMAVGETRDSAAVERGAPVRLALTRLATDRFQLDAHVALPLAADRDGARAERGQSLWLGLTPARLPVHALVVSGGDVTGGALRVIVADTARVGESCTPDAPTAAAIVLPPSALLELGEVLPDSAVTRLAAVSDSRTYRVVPSDTLSPPFQPVREFAASLTDPHLAPVLDGAGRCLVDGGAPLAWGDPAWPAPCAAHVPVLRVRGSLVRPAGRSQGLLLVDGDLELGGGFEHWGVVVVQGRVHGMAGEDRLHGALLARGGIAIAAPAALHVRRASCAAAAALRAAATVSPITGFAWREWW
jgi:hypothetical protein